MTTSKQTSLSHTAYTASVSDAPAAGPFPGMSARAALFARSLGVAVLLGWLAVSEPRLLVLLAFALPFWIAAEIEARTTGFTKLMPARFSYSGLALVPSAAAGGDRPSHQPAPKAA